MKNYCGITIGPIGSTFEQARKTRELWAGSYLFSYLMRHLIKALQEELGLEPTQILIPYVKQVNGKDLLAGKLGAGLFPDRCVFELPQGKSFESHVLPAINQVKQALAKHLAEHINARQGYLSKNGYAPKNFALNKAEATAYFMQYFKVYALAQEHTEGAKPGHIVKSLFDQLDVLELQPQFNTLENHPYLQYFLTTSSFTADQEGQKNRISFLKQDAGIDASRFESGIEIAAADLLGDEQDQEPIKGQVDVRKALQTFIREQDEAKEPGATGDVGDLIAWLKERFNEKVKTYHKYLAIVQLDGDKFGQYIAQLPDQAAYQAFTKALAQFNLQALALIENYGGQAVFLGGDDALFFAPLRHDTQTLFDLVTQLDNAFESCIAQVPGNHASPTLSYGMALYYYKQPLTEALEKAIEQLYKAKAHSPDKNAVALFIQKHSGQQFALTLGKGSQNGALYSTFKSLLQNIVSGQDLLSAVAYTLQQNQALLQLIGQDKERLQSFFANQFNEAVHKKGTSQQFLQHLQVLIHTIYSTVTKENERAQVLYNCLRTIKFFDRNDNN